MNTDVRSSISQLVEAISALEEIHALGQTGDINFIPEPGQSDIDIFVYCDSIPSLEQRQQVYERCKDLYEESNLQVCEGGVWGTGDTFIIQGVETMFMYFDIDDTLNYLNEILAGNHPDSVKGFYPVGRCSTLMNIHSLYDDSGFFDRIKMTLSIYPEQLSEQLTQFHTSHSIDEEDFGRALLRRDVLFYHQVIEHCIDHFLQAVYSANKTYFPSRKRTQQYLDSFSLKPVDCYHRITEVIRHGSTPEGIETSLSMWTSLVAEFDTLTGRGN
ncbi:MAG: hypothetical protein K0R46_964 [Herbinix sp.]|nr:hypothetical protein [Herbinix sp.]